MSPRIEATDRFKKAARKKPRQMQEAIAQRIQMLASNPRHPQLRTHKMQGRQNVWEAYVDNDGNRITFQWDGDVILLRNNCNHDMLYRNP